MPSRLLEINKSDGEMSIRLRKVGSDIFRYVALSYCWGGPQTAATTTKNIDDYLNYIDIASLPRTIQDAIFITSKLEITHLWIDSICIIQDDSEDKAQEIGRMSDIYSNAYLTISGSRAAKAADSFIPSKSHRFQIEIPDRLRTDNQSEWQLERFGQVTDRCVRPVDVSASLEIACEDGRRGRISITRLVFSPLTIEPVSSRAWTYQERVLASRMLSFGTSISWWCRHAQKYDECTGDGFGGIEISDEDRFMIPTTPAELEKETVKQRTSVWQNVVRAFSMRLLSYSNDKLPAIAAIAQRFLQLRGGDEYLAGLWKTSLVDDLMWQPIDFNVTRPEEWRAPTWSWASVDGEMTFKPVLDILHGDQALISEIGYQFLPYSGNSRFGQLKSAHLTVRGRLGRTKRVLVAHVVDPPAEDAGWWAQEYLYDPDSHRRRRGRRTLLPRDAKNERAFREDLLERKNCVHIDVEEDALPYPDDDSDMWQTMHDEKFAIFGSEDVWCLALRGIIDWDFRSHSVRGGGDPGYDKRLDGLLLLPMDEGSGSFRRIGTFLVNIWDDGAYIEWGEEETIVLV